jgi:phosphatidylglycerol:prolipoprotein diacylglycerol transferase
MGDIVFPNIGLEFKEVSRIAFTIFGIEIYKYGLIICIGAILGVLMCCNEAKRTGQKPDLYLDFVFIGLLCGIVGARCYYLIFHDGSILDFFKIRDGGLAIYGGIIGGVVAAVVYTRVKKISLLLFLDTVAMSLTIGQIFGRWGNFFNREAFGSYTNNLLAMCLKAEQVSGLKLNGDTALYNGTVYPITVLNGTSYISVHPTFLYESVWNLCLLGVLFFVSRHKKFNGQVTATYLIGYGIGRFVIESLRTDQLMILGIPVSMLVSGAIVLIGVGIIIAKKNK